MNLNGATAFVTGGTGFIGGRLIESLVSDHGVHVKALVRNTEVGPGTFRAARCGVDFVNEDITNEAGLTKAITGCDFVFHCAFGSHGTLSEQRTVTVKGTAALLFAAEKTGTVSRFVNLSTATVFGTPQGNSIDERTSPRPSPNWQYAVDKWNAELLVSGSSVPATTLRLPSVYGPRSPAFTIYPIHELKTGRPVLVDNGIGQINPIYVDDVVQAILLAAIRKEAIGETFLLNGPDRITRREFYEHYERMLNLEKSRLIGMTASEIRSAHRKARWVATKSLPATVIGALKQSTTFKSAVGSSHLGSLAKSVWKRAHVRTPTESETAVLPLILPPEFMLDYFASKTHFDDSKARDQIGYEPKFTIGEGMSLTEQWARWSRMIP